MPHYYPLFTLIYLATNEFNDTGMQASRCVNTKIALLFFDIISFVLTLPIKQMKVFILHQHLQYYKQKLGPEKRLRGGQKMASIETK